jgi:hypothetical protein
MIGLLLAVESGQRRLRKPARRRARDGSEMAVSCILGRGVIGLSGRGLTCDPLINMTRANNVLKYQSLDQLLVQYIIQVVHSRTPLLFKYKTLQHDDDAN